MAWLIDWLQTIVVFILLAAVIELLLPNSSMQRYVKMVVSLLLLAMILQPFMSIFSKELTDFIPKLDNANVMSESQLKNSVEEKKVDIESGQRAYISEQVAVQLKRQVEEELRNEFQVVIDHLTLTLEDEQVHLEKPELLKQVTVYVRTKDEDEPTGAIEPVELISIQTSSHFPVKKNENIIQTKKIEEFLAKSWEIPTEVIVLVWEGGKRTNG